jgi:hypothetical protein
MAGETDLVSREEEEEKGGEMWGACVGADIDRLKRVT